MVEIASPSPLISEDDESLYEVVDGQVVEQDAMGAYEIRLASLLLAHLETFVRAHQLGRAAQEMLFDLAPAMNRKRRPDVAFVSFQRWLKQRRIPRTEAWEVIPNLAVEVVSPTNRVDDMLDKVVEYFQAGVEQVWVIFPSHEHVYVYASPTQVNILTRSDTLHGGAILPHFQLPLTELFDDTGDG